MVHVVKGRQYSAYTACTIQATSMSAPQSQRWSLRLTIDLDTDNFQSQETNSTFFWKAPVDNIDSRTSLFCIHPTTICTCSVRFNLILPRRHFEAAHLSRSWSHSRTCQWAVCCSIPSPVMLRKMIFLAQIESFPVTSHS